MKKRYILIAIILFLIIAGKANAAVGDLIYEITNLNINDTENGIKITFEGWAFIHLTNNFKGDFREGKSNYIGEPSYDGGQEIMIIAEDQNGNKTYLKNILYDGYKGNNAEKLKKYNFYYMQFYDKSNANVENEYYTNYNHLTGNYDSNTCKMYGGHNSQCIYEDIGFHIEFNIENLSSDTTYKFYLYATNTDYNNKYNIDSNKASGTFDMKGKVANLKNGGKNWCGSEIYFYEDVLKKNTTGKVEIIGNSYSKDQVFVTVQSGMPRLCSGSINTCGVVGGTENYIENTTYNLYGEKKIERTECLEYNCGPGDYVINTNNSGLHPGTGNYTRIYRSWAVPAGSTTLTIKVKSDKKCEVSEPTDDKEMKCNNWTNLSSTCNELTVRNGNSSATVKIVQNGYISNIFKSNLVNNDTNYDASSYDGGWFKYGIIYYNEVSWELRNLSQGNENEIEEAMQYRLKEKLSDFEVNLNLTINGLDGSRLIKKCTESGEFKNGKKLVTVCTFFLPDIDAISSTGKVSYKESDDNDNINNKYYIPFNEKEHKHSVSVILTGLSRLSENQAAKDSKEQNKEWFGTWEIDTGCNLKVVNRLYNPPGGGDGKLKYKFIYRPIDLSNPFPNRFPGVNWYSWYIIENNKGKKTLEESYNKLEYSAELNNATISEIKKYNKDNNYFGEVDKDFFKNYIIKEGGNS